MPHEWQKEGSDISVLSRSLTLKPPRRPEGRLMSDFDAITDLHVRHFRNVGRALASLVVGLICALGVIVGVYMGWPKGLVFMTPLLVLVVHLPFRFAALASGQELLRWRKMDLTTYEDARHRAMLR